MKKILVSAIFSLSLFAQEQTIQIFKPITSSCPQSWLNDLKTEVSDIQIVSLIDVRNLKREVGIPKEIQSCNTSFLNDYVFEGNVPTLAIKDFFKNIPKDAIGLALPAHENDKKEKTVFVIFEDKTYKEFGKYK